MTQTKLHQIAELRPERIQLRAMAPTVSELRPERIQLQARLDALSSDAAWQVGDDGQSLTGTFARPPKAELADLVCLITDVAPRFGVSPRVSFQDAVARVHFTGHEGELSRRAVGFAALVDDLFPALSGSTPSDPTEDDGGATGAPEGEPMDEPGTDVPVEPTEPVGDGLVTA